jgi:branched-chain amino acid aminotransferase
MSEYRIAYFRDGFVPVADAQVSIKSRALNYGLGCFEGIRAYWNKEDERLRIFRVRDHYQRLLNSCKILCLDCGVTVEKMIEVTAELCRRNEVRADAYIRPLLFNVAETIAPIMTAENEFAIYVVPLRDYLDTSKGITACVSSWRRVSETAIPARAKPTGAYLNSALARFEARANGFDEAIFLTADGYVSEGSAEHIFLVRDGKLITPTSQEDNLEGITRRTVLELAAELGRTALERRVARTELYVADEVFFCGTGAEITPVTEIDRRPVGDGTPGPMTSELQTLFFEVVRGQVEKFSPWCHLV